MNSRMVACMIRLAPQETQKMMKTIVIGAGVMGASAAYRLAQAGASVTVLEATRVGGGTSGISFAWTKPTSGKGARARSDADEVIG
jgi:glycine/D-amino acid oxidase-like deaminating enzyme